MPPYLTLPIEKGGRGLSTMNTTTLLVTLNLAGMFPGYLCYGWVADKLGPKRSLILYNSVRGVADSALCCSTHSLDHSCSRRPDRLLRYRLFCGIRDYWQRVLPYPHPRSRFGIYLQRRTRPELHCALHHWLDGDKKGLSWAFLLRAIAFVLTAMMATKLPETSGKNLE